MLTYAERERLAFINGDPSRELLAETADMHREIDTHSDKLQDQFEAGEQNTVDAYKPLKAELKQIKEKHETACKLLQSLAQSITQFLEK